MGIRWIPDVGAPALVTAIDLGTESFAPNWNEWAAYGTALVGYGAQYFMRDNEFIKNMGIAAFPWAAKKLYTRVKGMGTASMPQRLAMRSVSGRMSGSIQTIKPEFAGARLS